MDLSEPIDVDSGKLSQSLFGYFWWWDRGNKTVCERRGGRWARQPPQCKGAMMKRGSTATGNEKVSSSPDNGKSDLKSSTKY